MKSSGIITVLGGVGALALLGLMVVMGGDESEPVRPPVSESRAGASTSPSAAGNARGRGAASSQPSGTAPSRPGTAPQPSSEGSQPAPASAAGPAGDGEAGTRAQAGAQGDVSSAGQAGAASTDAVGTSGEAGTPSEVQKVLELARRAERVDERINAVRWLGENGAPQQFDALQDIQINDPSPEVRAAAELAVNTLRSRRANEAWPGVTPQADPQDYMRGVTRPSP